MLCINNEFLCLFLAQTPHSLGRFLCKFRKSCANAERPFFLTLPRIRSEKWEQKLVLFWESFIGIWVTRNRGFERRVFNGPPLEGGRKAAVCLLAQAAHNKARPSCRIAKEKKEN